MVKFPAAGIGSGSSDSNRGPEKAFRPFWLAKAREPSGTEWERRSSPRAELSKGEEEPPDEAGGARTRDAM